MPHKTSPEKVGGRLKTSCRHEGRRDSPAPHDSFANDTGLTFLAPSKKDDVSDLRISVGPTFK